MNASWHQLQPTADHVPFTVHSSPMRQLTEKSLY